MHEVIVKGILSANNGINLYRGCQHGCIYCDSRSKCYQINHDFEDIEVKKNAIELLEKTLKGKRKKCMIGTGAMTDPYIPIELKLNNTRKMLELIEKYDFGVAIQTKSDRVLRDLDILKKINEKTKCVVEMTLTTFDDDLCKILEPKVSVTSKRFEVLKKLRDEGIETVVWLCPILPFINDTEENLNGILDYCIDAKVYGIICFNFGLTLREGNREYFYNALDTYFPGIKRKYINTYGDSYEILSENNKKLMQIFKDRCRTNNIVSDVNSIFNYMNTYETKGYEQISFSW